MYIIHVIFIIITTIKMSVGDSDESCCIKSKLKCLSIELVDSFQKFARKLRSLFEHPVKILEFRRQKLKAAFNAFTDEYFSVNESRLSIAPNVSDELYSTSNTPIKSTQNYKVETHETYTTDGYKLHLVRMTIPSNKQRTDKIALLHHGLLGSADDWIILGPKKSLPYLLLNAGYDVWLANARGNKYSRGHANKAINTSEYWDYSWHEIGQFDVSAAIDYIRTLTDGRSRIDFIGHSMGCTALLVLLATTPRYNHVLRSATFMAPLVFMYQAKGLIRLLAEFLKHNGIDSLSFLGDGQFMPHEAFPRQVIQRFCSGDELLCLNPWLLLANGGQKVLNSTLKASILRHVPSGGSTKTITHYCQSVTSGQFQMFDSGPLGNFKKYGNKSPPVYRLNEVTVPVVLFSSDHDLLATSPDILSLLPSLVNPIVHHVVRRHQFSHTDFVWAEDAPDLVYDLIIRILKDVLKPA